MKNRFNKYKAIKTDGYDSKKEAKRAAELKLLLRAGEIKDLQEQVRFELQPAFRTKDGEAIRKIEYIADFVYYDNRKQALICEDSKGFQTKDFLLKKKMFQFRYRDIVFLLT
jgi:hypothetical protein